MMTEKRPPVNPRPKITVKPQVAKPSRAAQKDHGFSVGWLAEGATTHRRGRWSLYFEDLIATSIRGDFITKNNDNAVVEFFKDERQWQWLPIQGLVGAKSAEYKYRIGSILEIGGPGEPTSEKADSIHVNITGDAKPMTEAVNEVVKRLPKAMRKVKTALDSVAQAAAASGASISEVAKALSHLQRAGLATADGEMIPAEPCKPVEPIEINLPGIASHEAVSAQLLKQIQSGVQLATMFADPDGSEDIELGFATPIPKPPKRPTTADRLRPRIEGDPGDVESHFDDIDEGLTDKEGKLPDEHGGWSAPAQAEPSFIWTVLKYVASAMVAGAIFKMVEQLLLS